MLVVARPLLLSWHVWRLLVQYFSCFHGSNGGTCCPAL
uniref:ATP binding / ATP-dependent DNA helicase/ ATP-dependent helicase/ helicase/ nucleic acid binding n=1 Tax=Arundo donax TaxID=35708 RepID=A0A0A9FFR8_ARUDO